MGRNESDFWATIRAIHERAPIWVGPVLACGFFILGYFVVPAVLANTKPAGVSFVGFTPVARLLGSAIALLVLIDWIGVELRKGSIRRLFDRQTPDAALATMSWSDFEYYVAEAFRREGYGVERTGAPAGDGGVDIILRKDGQTTLVQCKHWKAWSVPIQPVRELLGVAASRSAQAAVLVTSGGFTRDARQFAGANRIRLIDGKELRLMIASLRNQPSPTPSTQTPGPPTPPPPRPQTVPPQPTSATVPLCPSCGSPMALRTAHRGTRAGSKFWGCTRYPQCRGTRPA